MHWTTFAPSSSVELIRRVRPGVFLALLILFSAWQSFRTHRIFNDTADEEVHVAAGVEIWQHHRYTKEPQHPPLARAVLALPPFLAGLRLNEAGWLWTEPPREFYWRTLSLARLGNLLFLPLLVICVYLWARDLHGPGAGLGAAALAAFCPNLLAHASLATLDFGAAVMTFAAAFCLWRWSFQPASVARGAGAAAACSLAMLTKFSAMFFLPLIGLGFFALQRRRPSIRSAAVAGVLVPVLLWAGYGFSVGPLPAAQFPAPHGTLTAILRERTEGFLGQTRVPAPQLVRGVLDVLGHNAQGHHSFLLGKLGHHGWWYYFPVVLAVKSTLPLLILAALALTRWRPPMAGPALAGLVVLAVSMTSSLNLGVRHILVLYPLFAILAARGFTAGRRIAGVSLALVLWHGAESIAAHPDYLPYFNQTVRSRAHEVLLDSNLDWGQDLERLRVFLSKRGVKSVYLSYFGRANPDRFLEGVRRLPPDLRPAGWVAVSRAHVAGLALDGYNLGWLKAHQPVATVGKSLLVYYFPEPAAGLERDP